MLTPRERVLKTGPLEEEGMFHPSDLDRTVQNYRPK